MFVRIPVLMGKIIFHTRLSSKTRGYHKIQFSSFCGGLWMHYAQSCQIFITFLDVIQILGSLMFQYHIQICTIVGNDFDYSIESKWKIFESPITIFYRTTFRTKCARKLSIFEIKPLLIIVVSSTSYIRACNTELQLQSRKSLNDIIDSSTTEDIIGTC